MMKKIKIVLGSFFLLGVLFMNFVMANAPGEDTKSFSLKNLEALHASASEAYCDQTNQSSCTIRYGTTTGYSIGNYVISNK